MKRFKNYKIISLLSALVFFGGVKVAFGFGFPSWEEIWMALGNTLLFLAAQVLRIAGILFNCVMDYTINFSELIKNTGVVNLGWEIFRDISNMLFIFILLTISIATILGFQSYGAKQLLTKVILVALLMNFSLFTTKVIIDAANVFTVGFYNATIKNAKGEGIDTWDKGITSIFSGALNLNTIYKNRDMGATKGEDRSGTKLNGGNILTVALMGSVLLVVTAFVFFAASVLFMKRIVVLMFLMMLSPLAFLGIILPATSKYSKQWWDTLFKEAFYAPVFMMFIYVVARAISTNTFRDNISKASQIEGKGFANLATGGDTMLILFNFILIIGLMLASIITASKLGASGASGMMSMGKSLNKWGQGKIKAGAGAATFGVGGRLGRRFIGGAAQRRAEKIEGTDYARTARGRLELKTLRKVGDSSFDVRNTEAGKKMGIGTGIKGGYKTRRDNITQKETEYAKSLKGDTTDATGNTISRTEAYARDVGNRQAGRSLLTGTMFEGNRRAGENLVAEYDSKRNLNTARKALQRAEQALRTQNNIIMQARSSGGSLTRLLPIKERAEVERNTRRTTVEEAQKAYDKTKEKNKN